MSLGAGFFDFVSGMTAADDRIYPLTLPQGVTLPAVIYRVVSEVPELSHSTAQDSPTYTGVRFVRTRMQVDCYGRTYDEAEGLCDELGPLVSGYRGPWGDIEVDGAVLDIRLDDWDEDLGIYRVIQDVFVPHRYQASSS